MSYTITKTDGTILTTISDGSVDTSSTNLSLPGPNFVGYGQKLNENLVHLLENFSANSPPSGTNIEGQLWFDKFHQTLNVFTNQGFTPVSGVTLSSTQPVTQKDGDIWFNTSTNQIYLSSAGTFNLVGPNYTKSMGISGAIPSIVADGQVAGVNHNILQLQFGNITIATFSSDPSFVPSTPITGFPRIYPGITINSTLISGSAQLYTNSNVAVYLPSDGTILGIQGNAAAQEAEINQLRSDLTVTNINLIQANSTAVAHTDSVNATMVANITATNAAIITANVGMKSYVDAQIYSNGTGINAAIVTANVGMKSYVDAINSASTANASSQQTTINTLVSQVYANANVAVYLLNNTGNINAGKITANTPAYNDNSRTVATTAYVNTVVPRGVIWMWNSSATTIPTGWQLCDGSNGTPDLRGQFVIASTGDTGTYIAGNTGGSSSTTLTLNNLPTHAHSISLSGGTSASGLHNHAVTTTVNDAGHTHTTDAAKNATRTASVASGSTSIITPTGATIDTAFTNISVATSLADSPTHTHSISLSGTTGNIGSTTAIDNRPPFYALCYIQKMY